MPRRPPPPWTGHAVHATSSDSKPLALPGTAPYRLPRSQKATALRSQTPATPKPLLKPLDARSPHGPLPFTKPYTKAQQTHAVEPTNQTTLLNQQTSPRS